VRCAARHAHVPLWHGVLPDLIAPLLPVGMQCAATVLSRFLHTPSLPTLDRTTKEYRIPLTFGNDPAVFGALVNVYKDLMEKKGISLGDCAVVQAEDEVAVTAMAECGLVDFERNEVILHGFCGPLCGPGGVHKCGLAGVTFSANGTCQMADLKRIFREYRIGHYVSVVMIVPLRADLPVAVCNIAITCNRFTTSDVQAKWAFLDDAYYASGLGAVLGPMLGHASDGDARRRGGQLQASLRSAIKLESGTSLYTGVDGSDLCVTVTKVGATTRFSGLSVQDYIHCYKKLFNCFRDTKDMALGMYSISMAAVAEAVESVGVEEHGIRAGDIGHDRNRQNTRPILRMVSDKARAAIAGLPDFEERHKGTHAFLSVIAEFISMYEDDSLPWVARVESAGYVVHFLRYWRAWVAAAPDHTLGKHFVTPEALLDVEIACAAFVNLVGLWKDFELCNVPPLVRRMASEACEVLFSRVGGWVLNKHVQTALGFKRAVESQMALMAMESRVEGLDADAFSYRRHTGKPSGVVGSVAAMPDRAARNVAYETGKQRAFVAVQALIAGSSSALASEGYSKTFTLHRDLHGQLTVPKTFIMVPSKVTVVLREEDDLDQIDLSDMELVVDIDNEAAFVGLEQLVGVAGESVLEAVGSHGGAAGSGAGGGSAAAAGDGPGGSGGAAALCPVSDVAPELDGCGVASPGTMGLAEVALNDAVVLGIAPPGLGKRAGLTADNVLAAVDSIPGLSAGALASLGVREPASAPGSGAGSSAGAAADRRRGLKMDVEQGPGKSSKRMYVSTIVSLLNCIPGASTDRMVRIINAAKDQANVTKSEGVGADAPAGLTRGSLCAVLFNSDGAKGPSSVWYGFVRRYGVRVGTKFREWMSPVDFDDDTTDEGLVLQFTWLAPADRKHWPNSSTPLFAFKSFGSAGAQEGTLPSPHVPHRR
jgi:hypothetical protein